MRLPKSIACLSGIAICAFATRNAHAQSSTNDVTLTLTETLQAAETPFTKGTNELIKLETRNVVLNTADIITELSHATNMGFTASSAAKLVLLLGASNTQFAVSDGANFFRINTNVMSLSQPSNPVFSGAGEASGILPAPTVKALQVSELDFNDVGMGASDLRFSLSGIESVTVSGAKALQGGETESISIKMGLAGGGSVGGNTNFVAIGSLSGTGKGLIFP